MDGFSGSVGVCLSEGGVLAACSALLGEAIWICLRAKGFGAERREAEHEKVCVRQKENLSALKRDRKEGEGALSVSRGHLSISWGWEGKAWPEMVVSWFVLVARVSTCVASSPCHQCGAAGPRVNPQIPQQAQAGIKLLELVLATLPV